MDRSIRSNEASRLRKLARNAGLRLWEGRGYARCVAIIALTIACSPVFAFAAPPGGQLFGTDAQTPINAVKVVIRVLYWGMYFVGFCFACAGAVAMGKENGQGGGYMWKFGAAGVCVGIPGIYELLTIMGYGQLPQLDYNVQ